MEDVSDLGGVGVAGEGEAVLLEGELGGADVALAEHGEVGGAPGVVGPAVAAVDLLRELRGEVEIHGCRLTERNGGGGAAAAAAEEEENGKGARVGG